MPGVLVISIDFELYWGIRDIAPLALYENTLRAARRILPELLGLFSEFSIHATWAYVGFLSFETKQELVASLPKLRPSYRIREYCPYAYVDQIGETEAEDPFHFAPSLIRTVQSYPNQEIGTHTLSHYYCLEDGQNVDTFRSDLNAAIGAARKLGDRKSVV